MVGQGTGYRRGSVWARSAIRAGRLWPRLFTEELRRPVFIVGCGRSGTTLVAGLLDTHPEVAVYPTEANDLWHPGAYPWRRTALDTAPFLVDPKGFTEASTAQWVDDDTHTLMGCFRAFQRFSHAAVFANKSAMLAFMIPRVLELFPRCRFIHVLRDGRPVACSYAKKQAEKQDLHRRVFEERGEFYSMDELLLLAARTWSTQVEEILRRVDQLALGSHRLLEVRYERLCSRPEHELQRIAAFLGIAPSAFDRSRVAKIRSRDDSYRSSLDSDQIAAITDATRHVRATTGYAG